MSFERWKMKVTCDIGWTKGNSWYPWTF